MKTIFYELIINLVFITSSLSQNDVTLLNDAITNDTVAINAIALYPSNIRENILQACMYPEALVRMESTQKNTSLEFKSLLVSFTQEEQQKIWDLTRYPGLVEKLVTGGKKTKEEIQKILLQYPTEIHETALKYGRNYYDVLLKIDALNKKFSANFESQIKEYSSETQSSLRNLVEYPEAISVLNENMRTSVLLGDIYKRNPGLVKQKLDSLNIALSKENESDLAAWKNGLENNPDAKKEFESSAKEYAKEQGYCAKDIEVSDPEIIVRYVSYPYPYWYGYPYWWATPRWYPYPYWYDWGYYYGPRGFVFIGLPSWHFTHWYFYNHPHHYYYPHFSDYCLEYYNHHHFTVNGMHREIRNWMHYNEPYVPRGYFDNPTGRPERLKEYGKFEMKYNRSGQNVSRYDYLERNAKAYPNLRPALNEKPRPQENTPRNPSPREPKKEPNDYPPVRVPRQDRNTAPAPQTPTPPTPRPQTPRPQNPRPQTPAPQPQATPQTPKPRPEVSPRRQDAATPKAPDTRKERRKPNK